MFYAGRRDERNKVFYKWVASFGFVVTELAIFAGVLLLEDSILDVIMAAAFLILCFVPYDEEILFTTLA